MKSIKVFVLMACLVAFPSFHVYAASTDYVTTDEMEKLSELAVKYIKATQDLQTASPKEVKRMHAQYMLGTKLDNAEFVADGTMTKKEADQNMAELKKIDDETWKKTFLATLKSYGILDLDLVEFKKKLFSTRADWQRITPTKIQAAFEKDMPQPYNAMTLTFRLVNGQWIVF